LAYLEIRQKAKGQSRQIFGKSGQYIGQTPCFRQNHRQNPNFSAKVPAKPLIFGKSEGKTPHFRQKYRQNCRFLAKEWAKVRSKNRIQAHLFNNFVYKSWDFAFLHYFFQYFEPENIVKDLLMAFST
jgi:hypothetical protein